MASVGGPAGAGGGSTSVGNSLGATMLKKAIETAQRNNNLDNAKESSTANKAQGKNPSLHPFLGRNIDIYV